MTSLIQRIKRAFGSRVIKRWGSARAKKALWDREFVRGHWDYLESTKSDPIYRYLAEYANKGSILDLGCGSGNTANELDYSTYSSYTGTDISDVAIQRAAERTRQNGREGKNSYFCADIETFEPKTVYDLVLFRESLFYVPIGRIKTVLRRYEKYLKSQGVFIVRMCDRHRYKDIVQLLTEYYHLVDIHVVDGANDIILVFRPIGEVIQAQTTRDGHDCLE